MAVPGTPQQTTTFTVPATSGVKRGMRRACRWLTALRLRVGNAVLQWKWSATDGSKWYDCAYVYILE